VDQKEVAFPIVRQVRRRTRGGDSFGEGNSLLKRVQRGRSQVFEEKIETQIGKQAEEMHIYRKRGRVVGNEPGRSRGGGRGWEKLLQDRGGGGRKKRRRNWGAILEIDRGGREGVFLGGEVRGTIGNDCLGEGREKKKED